MKANQRSRWLAAPLALALATLACDALSGGASATETPPRPRVPTQTAKAEAATVDPRLDRGETEATATKAPRPTRTPLPALPSPTPPPGSGDVVYFTDFDDLDDWTTIFAIPETENYIAEIQEGKLYIQVDDQGTTVYAFYDFDLEQPDIQIDADVETVAGPNRNNVSLVCRATSDGWYEFSMNSGGFWFIWRYDDDGFTSLAEGGSTAINLQKSKNHLTAVCQGDTLTLFVNDEEVGSVSDDKFTAGQVGVSATTFNIKGAGVEFDNMMVSIP